VTRLKIDPKNPTPVWKQIEEGIRGMIAAGHLAPGDAVPSVRALATELVVNPNTVARTYQALADAGVLIMRRGEGTFVAADAPAAAKGESARLLREAAARYVDTSRTVGASPEDAILQVTVQLARAERAEGGRR
jgi:GntR family transcriptional regulator